MHINFASMSLCRVAAWHKVDVQLRYHDHMTKCTAVSMAALCPIHTCRLTGGGFSLLYKAA